MLRLGKALNLWLLSWVKKPLSKRLSFLKKAVA